MPGLTPEQNQDRGIVSPEVLKQLESVLGPSITQVIDNLGPDELVKSILDYAKFLKPHELEELRTTLEKYNKNFAKLTEIVTKLFEGKDIQDTLATMSPETIKQLISDIVIGNEKQLELERLLNKGQKEQVIKALAQELPEAQKDKARLLRMARTLSHDDALSPETQKELKETLDSIRTIMGNLRGTLAELWLREAAKIAMGGATSTDAIIKIFFESTSGNATSKQDNREEGKTSINFESSPLVALKNEEERHFKDLEKELADTIQEYSEALAIVAFGAPMESKHARYVLLPEIDARIGQLRRELRISRPYAVAA